MLRKSITLAAITFLATGCSQSLQGLVYTRGAAPEEFHYPRVQYGHVASVTLLDQNGKENSVLSANTAPLTNIANTEKYSTPKVLDPRISSQADAEDTNKTDAKTSAIDSLDTTPPAESKPANQLQSSTKSSSTHLSPVEITQKIRQLGLYDFVCTNPATGTECTYTPSADLQSTPVNESKKYRIKVRLDDGKDYWFNQISSPNWTPQPADRVKVFFSDDPATGVSRALRIQHSIPKPDAEVAPATPSK